MLSQNWRLATWRDYARWQNLEESDRDVFLCPFFNTKNLEQIKAESLFHVVNTAECRVN